MKNIRCKLGLHDYKLVRKNKDGTTTQKCKRCGKKTKRYQFQDLYLSFPFRRYNIPM